MKECYPSISLARICRLFGMSRQAYYQHSWRNLDIQIEHEIVVQLVGQIRKTQPMIGTRKLYLLLQQQLIDHQIKIGRDALFDLLSVNKMLVRRRKRHMYTTNSFHWLRKYPNLVRDIILNAPNQLWVSDITYIKTKAGYVYLSFITDAYSKKIMGYYLADNLEAINCVRALNMAVKHLPVQHTGLIHHSDRGIQYCSSQYVERLKKYNIQISMTENSDPLENAIAERVNGIIKQEFLYNKQLLNLSQTKKELKNAVSIYNTQRPHMSCNMLTPNQAHQCTGVLERKWKNYYSKSTNVN